MHRGFAQPSFQPCLDLLSHSYPPSYPARELALDVLPDLVSGGGASILLGARDLDRAGLYAILLISLCVSRSGSCTSFHSRCFSHRASSALLCRFARSNSRLRSRRDSCSRSELFFVAHSWRNPAMTDSKPTAMDALPRVSYLDVPFFCCLDDSSQSS